MAADDFSCSDLLSDNVTSSEFEEVDEVVEVPSFYLRFFRGFCKDFKE